MAADAATEATSTMTEACGTRTTNAFIDQTPRHDLRATGRPQVGPGLAVVGRADHGPPGVGTPIHMDRPEITDGAVREPKEWDCDAAPLSDEAGRACAQAPQGVQRELQKTGARARCRRLCAVESEEPGAENDRHRHQPPHLFRPPARECQ